MLGRRRAFWEKRQEGELGMKLTRHCRAPRGTPAGRRGAARILSAARALTPQPWSRGRILHFVYRVGAEPGSGARARGPELPWHRQPPAPPAGAGAARGLAASRLIDGWAVQ